MNNIETLVCDVLVIGSGGTGSQAAQASAEEGLNVVVISKDPMSSSDTNMRYWPHAPCAAVVSSELEAAWVHGAARCCQMIKDDTQGTWRLG